MRVAGKWLLCDDGVTRPTVHLGVVRADGGLTDEDFLLDSGADRTVFSAALFAKLQFPTNHSSPGFGLQGISGDSPFVLVATALEFARDDGLTVRVRGDYAAFTDPDATDLSILGRDVLAHFDVILSRRRHEILLLAGGHQYHVT